MNIRTESPDRFIEPMVLHGFRQKTEQLMSNLDSNNLEEVFRCINEINQINNQSIFTIVGKITRDLHNAIADLHIPVETTGIVNDRARAGLDYVIALTHEAARKTLDMTEQSQAALASLGTNLERQQQLLQQLAATTTDTATRHQLDELLSLGTCSSTRVTQMHHNITEIVVAQNFQDLSSQSIRKAINVIREVEGSLVMLVHYTNLLRQHSHGAALAPEVRESDEVPRRPAGKREETEHMNQNDVDNLLSSLGF